MGSALEWYDFFIYGTASALVFGELFFPKSDTDVGGVTLGTLAAYATFAVGFIARPFGGLFFGHFGDRFGRKPMLVATILLVENMAGAPWGVACYVILLSPITVVAVWWGPETNTSDIAADTPADIATERQTGARLA